MPGDSIEPVPPGFRSVTPYLSIEGASAAVEFYKRAFDAAELERETMPDGKLLHARIRIGDSMVMLSDWFPGSPHPAATQLSGSPVTLHIYSADVDRFWEQAVAAGANPIMPLSDQFWGERYGQLIDPFGHAWSLSMRIPMTPEEMEAKRRESMAMFEQGQHPGSSA